MALHCYYRMDFAFQGKYPPSKLVAMVASSSQVHVVNGWLIDIGCFDYVTLDLVHLSL